MKPIWIVDDDASIRWVLEKALARESLETRSFANAREALAAFELETPQVLVSDIRMPGSAAQALPLSPEGWVGLLELQAAGMLSAGQMDVMDVLGRQFESALIRTALKHTHGRKNDAAMRLGIGRNTITRKIGELGIDGARDE